MSVRTTTVVGTGLAALAFIGVAAIFGESLSALVAPPPAIDNASAAHAAGTSAPGTATTQTVPTGATGAKVSGDGGTTLASPDGSS